MSRLTSSLSRTEHFEPGSQSKQFVLFNLGNDLFGVQVEQVIQVQHYETVTNIPGAPLYVLGVLNLRGTIVTVIFLKKRLHLSEDMPEKGQGHVLFVEYGEQIIGMLVDKVLTLRSIPAEDIREDLTLISSQIPLEYLSGAATLDDQIIVLLNLKKILSDYEVEEIFREQEKLERVLKKKEEMVLPEEKLSKLDLEDDKDPKDAKSKRKKKKK